MELKAKEYEPADLIFLTKKNKKKKEKRRHLDGEHRYTKSARVRRPVLAHFRITSERERARFHEAEGKSGTRRRRCRLVKPTGRGI